METVVIATQSIDYGALVKFENNFLDLLIMIDELFTKNLYKTVKIHLRIKKCMHRMPVKFP